MGYAVEGVQLDNYMRENKKSEYLAIQKYLNENPDVKKYKGYTKEEIAIEIQKLNKTIEYLP